MSILPRPLVAVVATGLSLGLSFGLAAGPATAAPVKKATKAKVAAKAKTKAKAKSKAKVKAKKVAKADLTVKALHVDVTEEGTLLVSANLLNVGKGFAAPSNVVIALSDDNTWSDGDELLDELPFDRIGAGVTRRIDAEVDVPFDIDTTSDDLSVLVCADADAVVVEKSESNNCVSQEITLNDIDPVDEEATADNDSADQSAADDVSDEDA